MANLTLVIDGDLLRRARIRALEQGTSVNAVVRDYLRHYVGAGAAEDAIDAFLARAERSRASSGRGGRTWMRDDAHER